MIQPTRRGLLTALLFAPVIVKASSLMANKPPPLERRYDVEQEPDPHSPYFNGPWMRGA